MAVGQEGEGGWRSCLELHIAAGRGHIVQEGEEVEVEEGGKGNRLRSTSSTRVRDGEILYRVEEEEATKMLGVGPVDVMPATGSLPATASPLALPSDSWAAESFFRSFFDHSPVMMGVVEVVESTPPKKSKQSKKRSPPSPGDEIHPAGDLLNVQANAAVGRFFNQELSNVIGRRYTIASTCAVFRCASFGLLLSSWPCVLRSLWAPACLPRSCRHCASRQDSTLTMNHPTCNHTLRVRRGSRSSELGSPQACINEWIRKCEEATASALPVSWDFASPCGLGTRHVQALAVTFGRCLVCSHFPHHLCRLGPMAERRHLPAAAQPNRPEAVLLHSQRHHSEQGARAATTRQ